MKIQAMTVEQYDGELALIQEAYLNGSTSRREAEQAIADLKRRAGKR